MFDVPVLEVTASSAPVVITSVSRSKKSTLLRPQLFATLVDAAGAQSQRSDAGPEKAAQALPGTADVDAASTQVARPQGQFQLLEPLNLADATESLVEMFSLPLGDDAALLDADIESPPLPPVETSISAQVGMAEQQPSTASKGAIASPEKSTYRPPLPEALARCVDVPYGAVEGTTTFQLVRQGTVLGEVSARDGAEQVIRSFQAMLMPEQLAPNDIKPVLGDDQPAIHLGQDVFAQVVHDGAAEPASDTAVPNLNHEWTAITWSDQLRQHLGAAPLDAGEVQVMLKRFQPSEQQLDGIASWYGPYFHGRITANGETFDQNTLTAAHKTLPFNTLLQVRNLKNNRSVVVRINDRGPYIGKRSLDLSKAAAQCLDSETIGIIPYEAVILEQPNPIEG